MSPIRLTLLLTTLTAWLQTTAQIDSIATIKVKADSVLYKLQQLPKKNITAINNKIKTHTSVFANNLQKDLINQVKWKGKTNSFFDKKIRIAGGYNNYTYSFHGYIDTPIAQSSVRQHFANGYAGVKFFGIPLAVFYIVNRSNNSLFRNITDVRVEFDAPAFAQSISGRLRGIADTYINSLKDSLHQLITLNKPAVADYLRLKDKLNSLMLGQQYIEYKEILQLTNFGYSPGKADSINNKISDSLQKAARKFFIYYDSVKVMTERARKIYDSVERVYKRVTNKIAQIKNLQKINSDPAAVLKMAAKILEETKPGFKLPSIYTRLLDIRQFAVGRSRLDYSELTGKNINLKGVNFEYSSNRVYAAFAAGGIDYRYRDFGLPLYNAAKQFMYMVRLGKGRPEHNHFYVTLYKGQRQLTPSYSFSNNPPAVASVTGVSAEIKYVIKNNTTIVAEAAESAAPDFRTQPVTKAKFRFTDSRSQALFVSIRSYFPKTNSKIDAFYKYTGANFQSFGSYVTNNTLTAWQFKLDQSFLKRRIRVTGYLRQNVFSNPYIPQRYDSKTIFKSVSLTYKERRRPVISAGFMPVSQLIKLDNQIFETQFNSLSASAFHQYKINSITAASTLMVNRFYNNTNDTGFAYYNAVNIFFNQLFTFSRFSLTAAVNHMTNRDYELSVLNGGIAIPFGRQNQVSFGFKVNNFNKELSKTGSYGCLQLNMKKFGMLTATYDIGYVPGSNRQFIRNEFMIISLTQTF